MIWDLEKSSEPEVMREVSFEDEKENRFNASIARRDPHHKEFITVGIRDGLYSYDLRAPKIAYTIPNAHFTNILTFDYNPNKPYNLCSAAHDSFLKFWDIRKKHVPFKTLSHPSHWLVKYKSIKTFSFRIWSLKYNRFHDQLILTGSSSTEVNLWRVISVSSIPFSSEHANIQSSYL